MYDITDIVKDIDTGGGGAQGMVSDITQNFSNTPSLLKDTDYDTSREKTDFQRRTSFLNMPNMMEGIGMPPPGTGPPKINIPGSNMFKEFSNAHNVNKNFGPLGYLGQAMFNNNMPNMNLNLGGNLPRLNWSPNKNMDFAIGPDIKTGSGYGGVNVSGNFRF